MSWGRGEPRRRLAVRRQAPARLGSHPCTWTPSGPLPISVVSGKPLPWGSAGPRPCLTTGFRRWHELGSQLWVKACLPTPAVGALPTLKGAHRAGTVSWVILVAAACSSLESSRQ